MQTNFKDFDCLFFKNRMMAVEDLDTRQHYMEYMVKRLIGPFRDPKNFSNFDEIKLALLVTESPLIWKYR